jgi:uncharacterized protein (TIRG00374 family)
MTSLPPESESSSDGNSHNSAFPHSSTPSSKSDLSSPVTANSITELIPDSHAIAASPRRGLFLRNGLKTLATLGVLWFLSQQLDFEILKRDLAQADFGWLLWTLGSLFLEMVTNSFKISAMAGSGTTTLRMFRANSVKAFVNLFFPGPLGGEAVRGLWLAKDMGSTGGAAALVLWDRVSSLWLQVGATLVSLILIFGTGDASFWQALGLCLPGLALATFTLPWLVRRSLPFLMRLADRLGAGNVVSNLDKDFADHWKGMTAWRRSVPMFAWSAAMQFALMALVLASGRAAGAPIAWTEAAPIMLVVALVSVVPLTFGNIGVTEGAYAAGFAFFGHEPEAGVLASLILRVGHLPLSVPGALDLAFRGDALIPGFRRLKGVVGKGQGKKG